MEEDVIQDRNDRKEQDVEKDIKQYIEEHGIRCKGYKENAKEGLEENMKQQGQEDIEKDIDNIIEIWH